MKDECPGNERLASVIGFLDLVIASSISLWQMVVLSQAVDGDWLPDRFAKLPIAVIG